MSRQANKAGEASGNPTRFFRRPDDVVRDRSLSRAEKLVILEAWELDARALLVATEENMGNGEPSLLEEVVKARLALGEETHRTEDDGAPTKLGGRKVK